MKRIPEVSSVESVLKEFSTSLAHLGELASEDPKFYQGLVAECERLCNAFGVIAEGYSNGATILALYCLMEAQNEGLREVLNPAMVQ